MGEYSIRIRLRVASLGFELGHALEVCHPRCVCENRKGYVVKYNYVN